MVTALAQQQQFTTKMTIPFHQSVLLFLSYPSLDQPYNFLIISLSSCNFYLQSILFTVNLLMGIFGSINSLFYSMRPTKLSKSLNIHVQIRRNIVHNSMIVQIRHMIYIHTVWINCSITITPLKIVFKSSSQIIRKDDDLNRLVSFQK